MDFEIKVWDKASPIKLMDNKFYAPEEIAVKFPFVETETVILQIESGGAVSIIDPLYILQANYMIDSTLPLEEQIAQIWKIRMNERNPNYDEINELLDELEREVGV